MKSFPFRASRACCVGLAIGSRTLAGQETVDRVVPNLAALAGQPMTELPSPPPWVADPSSSQRTIGQIIDELEKATGKSPTVNYVRPMYVLPDYPWLIGFAKWFRKLGKPLNIHYEDGLFDCDKYSRCFVAFADILARKGGETRGSICMGWATVFNEHGFAGVAAGGAHAIVIVGTSRGLFVIEPQNGTMVPLSGYPNRETLVAVYF